MGQEMTKKKEIVEIEGGKGKVAPDDDRKLELTRTYRFDGEEVSSLDFSKLEDITAKDIIQANNIMESHGVYSVYSESTMYCALIIASDATGMPFEFFEKLKPKDAIAVKRLITRYFFGEG